MILVNGVNELENPWRRFLFVFASLSPRWLGFGIAEGPSVVHAPSSYPREPTDQLNLLKPHRGSNNRAFVGCWRSEHCWAGGSPTDSSSKAHPFDYADRFKMQLPTFYVPYFREMLPVGNKKKLKYRWHRVCFDYSASPRYSYTLPPGGEKDGRHGPCLDCLSSRFHRATRIPMYAPKIQDKKQSSFHRFDHFTALSPSTESPPQFEFVFGSSYI